MANKVKYGLKNVYYAVATVDAVTNTATYTTPVAWPGAVNLSLDAEGNTTKFRADNIDYWVGQSNNGYSGDFESALIPDSFRTDILGDVSPADHDGIMIEDAGAKTKYFALLFQFEGDANATLYALYNCKMSRPDIESSTTEDGIEVQTVTGEITASPRAFDNIVKASCANTASTAYSAWFTTVQD